MTEVSPHPSSEVQTPVSAEEAIAFCIIQVRRAPDIIRERLIRADIAR